MMFNIEGVVIMMGDEAAWSQQVFGARDPGDSRRDPVVYGKQHARKKRAYADKESCK